jgi:hypothetical protein
MQQRLSREVIERRLLQLERSPRPKNLHEGAMCYSPAAPPDHWVYVCPTCGKRTAYVSEWVVNLGSGASSAREPSDGERRVPGENPWREWLLLDPALRLARAFPKGCGISLDESALCAFCRPDAEEWEPVLVLELSGEPPRRLALNRHDVPILRAFVEGSDRYRDPFDSEYPLASAVRRLRDILLGGRPSLFENEA